MLLVMRYGNCTDQPQLQLSLGKAGVRPAGVPAHSGLAMASMDRENVEVYA